jgi:putative ABC transport system permease protein
MASIARKNLFEDIPRLLVAQAGIMFAVSLVTIQTGILKGFTRSTTLLIEQSRADVWVASSEMVNFELTEPLPHAYLSQAAQIEGVERVEPLLIGSGRWKSPTSKPTALRIFGFDPSGQLFVPGNLTAGKLEKLNQPYGVILDESNLKSLGVEGVGSTGLNRSMPTEVVGITENTQSIVSSKFMFTSLETAHTYITSGFTTRLDCELQPGGGMMQCASVYEPDQAAQESAPDPEPLTSTDPITYLMVKVAPGEDVQAVMDRLEATLPQTQAYTTEAIIDKTQTYWQTQTGIGFILGLGAAVGVVVGMVIVGQILYSSVSDHIKEFGTLKAMGASNWTIYSVILEQALWMAVLGYIPGMALCFGLGAWTATTQGIVILITPMTAVGVFGLTLGMCTVSAVFAIQKVTRVDPGIVFKA